MSATPVRIAVVGLGKIARDQHLPTLLAAPGFELVATVCPQGGTVPGVPGFLSLEALLASSLALDAVAICTPPQVRHTLALTAITRGLHVLLEKPPAANAAQFAALVAAASGHGVTLFAAWHSRFAAGVGPARRWLAERAIESAAIIWREDVRTWHPGQHWIWAPGGFGVFDPGINALSILTEIMPQPVALVSAELDVPVNHAMPIAARLALATTRGAPVSMDLDFRQTGEQTWTIAVETDGGMLHLANGGATLSLPEGTHIEPVSEYAALYAHFAQLIARGASDADPAPLHLADEALARGKRNDVEAFEP